MLLYNYIFFNIIMIFKILHDCVVVIIAYCLAGDDEEIVIMKIWRNENEDGYLVINELTAM